MDLYLLFLIQVLVYSVLCHCQIILKDNREQCDRSASSAWNVVAYSDMNVISPNNSKAALQANGDCCKSFPIYFEPGGLLLILVYTKVANAHSRVSIELFLEEEIDTRADNNTVNKYIGDAWNEIQINIKEECRGYIILKGYSEDNELVLVNSLRYIYNNVTLNADANTEFEFKEQNVNDNQNKEENTVPVFDVIDRMGINVENTKEEVGKNNRNDKSSGLGSWWIVLITVLSVTAAALIVTCAYHLGKLNAKPRIIPVIYDPEHPKVNMIPRVEGTTSEYGDAIQHYL